ncbi:MAG: cation acetate symporter [Kineosporiaceae bacterium]|nr:cation acetate symporter [Kineosporiaceae bacterium]
MNTESAVLFLALVAVTLYITYWAGKRNKSVETHLVAKGAIAGRQNGVAIAGDFISAATFLGTTGAIALGGFNGFYLAVYIPISYLLCLLLVAEPLRNLGHFTLGDVLASRFHGDGVRAAIATASVVVSLLYIVAQFVGAALLVQLLFGVKYWQAAGAIGLLTLIYTLFGGMIATTYIQIVKTAILLFCGALLLVLVLAKFGWNPLTIFQEAGEATKDAALKPVRKGTAAQWEQFSLIFGVTLGVLGLPHVMIRFLTVRDGAAARTSAVTAIWIFAVFLITLPFVSYGAMLLVGKEAIVKASKGGNLAMPQLAETLGGDLLLAFVSAVAFATILAALSGLVIATTGAVSHDIYGKLLRKGHVDHTRQLTVARATTVISVAISMLIALAAQKQNVAFLATLAIAVAASANLPALLFTIYWRKATAAGITAGMVAGLVTAVVIILLSPTFHGSAEGALLPISSPGIISVPVGFLVMYLVSLATQPKGEALAAANRLFDRIQVQAVTGIDPAKTVDLAGQGR